MHFQHLFARLYSSGRAWGTALWCVAGAACAGPSSDASAELPAPAVDAAEQRPVAVSDAVVEPSPTAELDADAGDSVQSPSPVIPTTPAELVNHLRWLRVEASADPFDDRPENVVCDVGATLPEPFNGVSAYGVDTGACNYATVHQPILRPVAAGETITVRLAHFQLTAPEDSQAHVALRIDGLPILDERIPIPSPSQVLVRSVAAPRAILVGASAYFHVHNHGANSYALISIAAAP